MIHFKTPFNFDGVEIHDITMDETGRFEVDSREYYDGVLDRTYVVTIQMEDGTDEVVYVTTNETDPLEVIHRVWDEYPTAYRFSASLAVVR